MVRRPAVAGAFYPGSKSSLLPYISNLFLSDRGPGAEPSVSEAGERRLLGIISPHAGYIYSGEIAAHGYYYLAKDGLPDTVILIGPNHTGLGGAISVYPSGSWETPLGSVKVDVDFVERLKETESFLSFDVDAHIYEHSIEVQIPFLQYIYGKVGKSFRIVPIVMMYQTVEGVKILGEALYKLFSEADLSRFLVVASTDFSHYVPAEKASEIDFKAIEKILALDPEGLISSVYRWNITMCGYGPVATLLYLAKKLGGYGARLLKYGHSGEVTKDDDSVVAYASIIVERI